MRRTAWPVLVRLVVALALLVTAAVLDAFLLNGQRVRVAFLPPWESGAGLLLTTFVGLALVAHRARSTPCACRAESCRRSHVRLWQSARR